jgi:hypothetical protein
MHHRGAVSMKADAVIERPVLDGAEIVEAAVVVRHQEFGELPTRLDRVRRIGCRIGHGVLSPKEVRNNPSTRQVKRFRECRQSPNYAPGRRNLSFLLGPPARFGYSSC